MSDAPTRERPAAWAMAVVALVALAGGSALLFTTFLAQHALLARAIGSAVGGLMLAGAAAASLIAPRLRPLAAFAAGMVTSFTGGPIALAVTMFVKGLQEGAGVRAFGAVIVAVLGMMCGWFISIPIGAGIGLVLSGLVFVVDRIPGSRVR